MYVETRISNEPGLQKSTKKREKESLSQQPRFDMKKNAEVFSQSLALSIRLSQTKKIHIHTHTHTDMCRTQEATEIY